MAVGRFQVMAVLQAARARTLGLSLESAHSWGLNRAIFYAAAKRGFRGTKPSSGVGASSRPKAAPRPAETEYHLGDDYAFLAEGATSKEPLFSFGGEPQTEGDFGRQVEARFGGSFKEVWEEALDYVQNFDRETLESRERFYSDIYKPKRDEFATKWTDLGAKNAKPVSAKTRRR